MRAAKTDAVAFLRHRFRVLLLLVILIGTTVHYFAHVPNHPAGFYLDESSIAYNAFTISQTGRTNLAVHGHSIFAPSTITKIPYTSICSRAFSGLLAQVYLSHA